MQFALAVFKVNVSSIIAGLAMIIAVISVIKFGNIIKKLGQDSSVCKKIRSSTG
jgi:hypothetical protein